MRLKHVTSCESCFWVVPRSGRTGAFDSTPLKSYEASIFENFDRYGSSLNGSLRTGISRWRLSEQNFRLTKIPTKWECQNAHLPPETKCCLPKHVWFSRNKIPDLCIICLGDKSSLKLKVLPYKWWAIFGISFLDNQTFSETEVWFVGVFSTHCYDQKYGEGIILALVCFGQKTTPVIGTHLGLFSRNVMMT
jgi:hypothetical protein